jgi:hypothetical protein
VFKICPTDPNLLVNPETGRCVQHKNPTIKKLLKEGWTIVSNNDRTLPVLIKTDGITNWKKLKSILDKNRDSIISIDEYLGTTEITEKEENSEDFSVFEARNLQFFLEKEILTNPILKRNVCMLSGENARFVLAFKPINNNGVRPYHIIDPYPNLYNHYEYIYYMYYTNLFNAPLSKSNLKEKPILVIFSKLESLLKRCKNRYLVTTLRLNPSDMETHYSPYGQPGHSNVLIFDTVNKTIERFDPHGSSNYSITYLSKDIKHKNLKVVPIFDQEKIDDFLQLEFKKLLPTYKYKDITFSCPYLGPQIKTDVRTGYCMTWSIMYTFLRLLNPDVPPGRISKMLINDKTENLKTKLLRFAAYYRSVILDKK